MIRNIKKKQEEDEDEGVVERMCGRQKRKVL